MNKENFSSIGSTIDDGALSILKDRLCDRLLQPGDEAFEKGATPWNLAAQQRPALVVMAESVEDIIAAVQFARSAQMGIGVMATGHGVTIPCDGGVLINTSRMRAVQVDPVTQTARVEPGAQWKHVISVCQPHGLATLAGSAPHVGVVGYTLGGGFGFLGRKYGLNAAGVVGAELVTADGEHIRVNSDENPELFWGLKGSGGNFGVITSLQFKLYPLQTVYGGAVFYPIEKAKELLTIYDQWAAGHPDEVTSAFTFMNIPPLPFLPEVLRGKFVVVIKGCYCGANPETVGEELFRQVRKEAGPVIMDTFGTMPASEMDQISKDPVDPMGVVGYGSLLHDLSTATIEKLITLAGPGSGNPLTILELRRLGGALQHNTNEIQFLGDGRALYSMNAIGGTMTAAMAEKNQQYLDLLIREMQPYETGETFLNFLEVNPTIARIRSAYTTSDWERLLALKKQYDPTNMFRFNRNIPSIG